jgi:hypothetical protein
MVPIVRGGFVKKFIYFAAAVSVALALSGCVAPSLTIPKGALNLPKCAPVATYDVVQIGKHSRVKCDLVGTKIAFPDGHTMTAPPGGSEDSEGGFGLNTGPTDTYDLFNFGTFGLVAARTTPDGKHTDWWGTKEGLRRYQAVFGTTGPRNNG